MSASMMLTAAHDRCGAHRKATELDVESVCTTNVTTLSVYFQYIYNKSELYTTFEFIIVFSE